MFFHVERSGAHYTKRDVVSQQEYVLEMSIPYAARCVSRGGTYPESLVVVSTLLYEVVLTIGRINLLRKEVVMSCTIHPNHPHVHSEHCGHTRVQHNDHIDYLHDGHLHHPHEGHYDEHVLEISATNPNQCVPIPCQCGHQGCGHEAVPHGDHIDYLVDGRLHHPHGDHCDDHGPLVVL